MAGAKKATENQSCQCHPHAPNSKASRPHRVCAQEHEEHQKPAVTISVLAKAVSSDSNSLEDDRNQITQNRCAPNGGLSVLPDGTSIDSRTIAQHVCKIHDRQKPAVQRIEPLLRMCRRTATRRVRVRQCQESCGKAPLWRRNPLESHGAPVRLAGHAPLRVSLRLLQQRSSATVVEPGIPLRRVVWS